ncbi:MAG: NUDIX domain-containing protein [Candidatus Jacksonbacteria bacterium]|nr:NUDIX domain-containing protein [Candidatus Jacksonbacteria bacterium]MBT6034221.1 NUDIX domain-containing protein [Candidatus Jacksonbacteria bacterium]MBT6301622.1 NUDIX domain-containing protein [Candidatus Jacksonbacteria bacterium]MBT6757233.1 NUDIX domain-containing protein [Candidatus Jacksonbacteria bacterium]MBT6955595.1 NUDIX domain-containing protein [Candidatus Jacksonbacteria bacterium]
MAINSNPHVHNLVMCANVFVRKDGKFLVLKRSAKKKHLANFIHPIGGKIEADEDPYIGAVREVKEEANIDIKNLKLESVILEVQYHQDMDENWLIFNFTADYDSGTITDTDEGELILLSKKELLNAELFASIKETIEQTLNPDDATIFATFTYNEKGEIATKTINTCQL